MHCAPTCTDDRSVGLLGGECRANGLETYSRRSENCNVSKVCLKIADSFIIMTVDCFLL